MCGPSGTGKSTALGLIAAQWFRYPGAQVFAFDKGFSLFALTHAAGREFYDLAGENSNLAFCPLAELDCDADVIWESSWIEDLCALNGMTLSPRHRNAITTAVQQLRLSPSRTLTELTANVQDMEVREALQYFTLSGPLGTLLDADEDMLGSGRFLDEAWAYLKHEVFRARLRDWLKTLRRLNGVVLLSTQNLSDICRSEISEVVLEMCPTKILLPNGEAKNPASREFYDRIGLNSRELEIIQGSIPKQHYYFISPLGRRLISLGLHDVTLSFVGINGREERQSLSDLMGCHGEGWQAEWLRSRAKVLKNPQLMEWADYFDQISQKAGANILCATA